MNGQFNNVTDSTGEMTVGSIRMPAPDYVAGTGSLEKRYTSIITVRASNQFGQ